MTNENDNRVERESTIGSRSYLDQYVGSSVSVSWGNEFVNGVLKSIDYTGNAAYFQPALVQNPDGRSYYLEDKFPTMVSLALLNPALTKVLVRPLRKGFLEEMACVKNGNSQAPNICEVKNKPDNVPYKSSGKIGFGV